MGEKKETAVITLKSGSLGYGELRQALFAVVEGEVVKNRNGNINVSVESVIQEEDDSEIRFIFKKVK